MAGPVGSGEAVGETAAEALIPAEGGETGRLMKLIMGGKEDKPPGPPPGSEAVFRLLEQLAVMARSAKFDGVVVITREPGTGMVRYHSAGPGVDGALSFLDSFGLLGVGHFLLERTIMTSAGPAPGPAGPAAPPTDGKPA